jgi:hypothetical protein
MPGKHKNRAKDKLGHKKTTGMLVTESDIANGNSSIFQHDRENIIPRMNSGARLEVQGIIRERLDTASPQTEDMKSLMAKLDLQYRGLFQDDMGDAEERFFLPKTREDADIIYAFILDTVTQLRPLVQMEPKLTSIMNATREYKQAKVAEFLIQFYFNDVWKIVDNQFPTWLKHFLKYPQAIYKVSYFETDYNPDLMLDVVDRALLYLDPGPKRIQECQWIIEREFITRHEVMERIDRKDWIIPSDNASSFEAHMTTGNTTDDELARFMGSNNRNDNNTSVEADELVEVFHYWQYPRKGLDDLYAVMVGGIEGSLVRYGRNFNPFKHNQYIGASYNQGDRPDGISLVEQKRPHQKLINSWVNMRNDDVLANVQQSQFLDGALMDKAAQDAIERGDRYIPAAEEVAEAWRNTGKKLSDAFGPTTGGTSTGELLSSDLPFILGQSSESSHLSDVFRGGNPPPGTPLGIVQEQLTRNAGFFKPIIRQVMLPFERIAEIMLEYHKDEEFYPTERVISIVGKNHYADVIDGWQDIAGEGGDVQAVAIEPDMLDVDVKFNAVSGADAFAAKTILNSTISSLFQGLGQIPEMVAEIKKDFNFSNLWEHMLNISGLDIDKLKFTPAQKEARAKEEKAAQNAELQQQAQQAQFQVDLQKQMEEAKAIAATILETAKAELKQKTQIAIDDNKIDAQEQADLVTKIAEIVAQQIADAKQAELEQDLEEDTMTKEAKLEKAAGVDNVNPAGGQNIQKKKGKTK